ncbi:MAG TPA: immunoglobulin domain-containing protein [Verrucomicrobiae bacterium]|nr:immunoglobulin domain-containing protein [Verrucomicrobiae bacterium]
MRTAPSTVLVALLCLIQVGTASSQTLVPLISEWHYNQFGTNLATAWREAAYDDSAWPIGTAAFALEDNPAVIPYTNTVLSLTNTAGARVITYYFRTRFPYSGSSDPVWLGLSTLVDDGAIVYLNGVEVYRLNMPPGPAAYGTLASNALNDAEFKGSDFLATNLINGENFLAVEVHQVSTTSSDVVFGLQLALATPPGITNQPENITVARTYDATFQVGASNQTILAYQWRKNGTDIPGAVGPSYTITNVQNGDAGSYSVTLSNVRGQAASSNAQLSVTVPYTFGTLAGTPRVFGTNDGIGYQARFNSPRGIAVDTNGCLYVCDFHNHTIRKITPDGVVSTLAGSPGIYGWKDGLGTDALFTSPRRATADRAGNLFVADNGNAVVRKITSDGNVTTIAGAPQQPGAANGTNTAARFDGPSDVAVDSSGNLFVADADNHSIRKITPSGSNWIVTTIAGNLTQGGIADGTNNLARFRHPIGLELDRDGNIYVTDNVAHNIRKIRPAGTNWIVTTLAGLADNPGYADGKGTHARFNAPIGVAVDAAGNVFIGDDGTMTVRKITPDGQVITIAGTPERPGSANGTGSAVRFDESRSVAVDADGNLYVADADLSGAQGNNTIRKGWPAETLAVMTLGPATKASSEIEIPVLVKTGAITNLSLMNAARLSGPWVTNTAAVLTTNVPGLAYRYTVPITGPIRFYQVKGQ